MSNHRDLPTQKTDSYQVENIDEMEKGSTDPISQYHVPADVQKQIRRQVMAAFLDTISGVLTFFSGIV